MPDGQHTVARAVRLLVRGLCLRCPRCGAHSLFRTWFAMYERCAVCQLRFEREQGYFLGAMYINYGVTVVLALIGSFTRRCWVGLSLTQQLVLWVGFVAFSRWCSFATRVVYGSRSTISLILLQTRGRGER